jgi:F-type H+-transporting ATPase subunit b
VVEAIHDEIDGGADVQFEVSPDLICGIELKAHGHKIAWGLESYLDGLEESLSEALAGGSEEKAGVRG